jgi:hypothetical protein
VANKRLSWFRLSTDYFQFYLLDEGIKPPVPTDYESQDTLAQRLLVEPHIIAVMTFQSGPITVGVEVVDGEPAATLSAWDHVVDASLELPTGRLAVDTCMCGVAKRFRVGKGWYRVRVCTGGIGGWESVAEGEEIPERFRITLWPADAAGVQVLKQWSGPVSA